MSYCVYLHICPNQKKYVGITSQNPCRRWANGDGYKGNKHFYSAIQKYGWDNIKHEIVCAGLTKEDACAKEVELVAYYKSNTPDFGYNQSVGGEVNEGWKHSEETRLKLKEISTGDKNPFYGKKHTAETKEKMSKNHADIKGEHNPNYGNHKLAGKNHPNYGKKMSVEQRQKQSNSHAHQKKKVVQMNICGEIIAVYESEKSAERETGIRQGSINYVCNGKRNTAGGYKWMYADDFQRLIK